MSRKVAEFECGWRILEYLCWNTDAEHPVRGLSALLKYCEALELLSRIHQRDTFSATAKERVFVEKMARVTYERERTVRLGLFLSDVRPAFAS